MRRPELVVAAISAIALAGLAHSAPAAEQGSFTALLIGIADYQHLRPLPLVQGDLRRLAEALVEHGAYEVDQIVDQAPQPGGGLFRASEAESLKTFVEKWLRGLAPADTALLYFTGHGFRDEQGQAYLAAIDCRPENPVPGGVSIAWLRERLQQCRARVKLLVLDACHAGSAKGAEAANEAKGITAEEIAKPLADLPGVVTLAACKASQESFIWPAKRQSIFSYWLARALAGHADANGDGRVDADEIFGFLDEEVAQTTERLFAKAQTPVRIVGPDVEGVPEIVRLRPVSLKGLVDDMAETIVTRLALRGKKEQRLAVPEMAVGNEVAVGLLATSRGGARGSQDNNLIPLLGRRYGQLARYCSSELSAALVRRAPYVSIVSPEKLYRLLAAKGLTPEAAGQLGPGLLGDAQIDAFVLAEIARQQGTEMRLACRVLSAGGDLLTMAGGLARLEASELAMIERSGTPRVDADPQPVDLLRSDDFPFRVGIRVVQGETFQAREITFDGTSHRVRLAKGEVYAIRIETRSDKVVFLRLLVDGLNTLPDYALYSEKGVIIEPIPRGAPRVRRQAQRVNLAEALAWTLHPPEEPGKWRPYQVSGFFSRSDAEGEYNAFEVTDAAGSEAGRQGYTEQIGVITAAFYLGAKPPPGGARAAGTRLGQRYQTHLDQYDGDLVPGPLLGVIHIHYGE